MNDEVIKMLVSVQDDLARAVLQVNVVQRRDDDVIAHLQRELQKQADRMERQETRADTLTDMLLATREQLARTKTELVRVNNELEYALVNQREQQTPRPPAKRKLFGDGDHDVVIHLYDLETPKKK